MAKDRFDYIDIARGLGILMVVWGHISWQHWSWKLVYTFHMPLFFVISGLLFRKEKYPSFRLFIRNRAKRLLIPYFWYSVITWAIWAGFSYLMHRPVESYWNPLFQTLLAQGSGEFMVHNSPLWFIPCLFAVEIMYYFSAKLNETLNLLLCFSLAGFSMLLEYEFGKAYLNVMPWNFDAALMSLPFYAVGNIIGNHFTHQQINGFVRSHKTICWGLVLGIFGLLIYSVHRWGSLSMGSSAYGNEAIFHIRALAGSGAVLTLAALLSLYAEKNPPALIAKAYNFVKWLGRVSLDVMCTHVPVKGIIIVIVTRLLHQSSNDAMANVALALLVFVITIVIDACIVNGIQRLKQMKFNFSKHSNH